MADHTPDCSNKDLLSVAVRMVGINGLLKERLLSISEADDKTGIGIANEILNILQNLKIDTSKLAFQSYDFASAMSGKFNGCQQRMSELVGHNIPYIPCQAHRVNTAVEHSCKASPLVSDMFNILEEIYVFFTSSVKRCQILKSQLEQVDNALFLKNLSRTRWTARAESLQAINRLYEIILETLEDISINVKVDNKTKGKAQGLYKRRLSFDFISYLIFLKTIFYKLKIVTELLESERLNVVDAVEEIKSTANIPERIRNNDKELRDPIDAAKQFAFKANISPEDDFKKHHRRRIIPKKNR
ncbi:uncharacterized protein LOC126750435 [Anthonomus grandis grandis]|uniref:uncharacterized protein LOC126750435 n=1 Tax=Anthonomus grandis grandis TaxID=2921223 RepID=UPI002166442E|nr:uncharacterized protein LOC126750435 [Anthonomus grandis grandis]